MKVIIVGGVAGGASCAARMRRLDEKCEILMVERGPYVSYANCGLPYHVGGSIEKESSLLVATEATFREQFAIDCRTRCEVVGISSEEKTVELKNHETGEVTTEHYDKLVLSPGAAPIRPPLPGIDLPGIFSVRTVPDARQIREWIERGTTYLAGTSGYSGIQMVKPVRRAVVVGGVWAWQGGSGILTQIALFFTQAAFVTFGGAYAVLAYMAQDVVNQQGWLTAGAMMDGLGLAETTPGPLILVTEFVGFLSAFGEGGLALGLAGAAVTLWATFTPCFLWIFAGSMYIAVFHKGVEN